MTFIAPLQSFRITSPGRLFKISAKKGRFGYESQNTLEAKSLGAGDIFMGSSWRKVPSSPTHRLYRHFFLFDCVYLVGFAFYELYIKKMENRFKFVNNLYY